MTSRETSSGGAMARMKSGSWRRGTAPQATLQATPQATPWGVVLLFLPMALVLPALQLAALFWLGWSRTPNVPMYDEWTDTVPLVVRASNRQLMPSDLWAPHVDHRIVLPRLLQLPLIFITHWNRQVEITFNLLVGAAIALVIVLAARRTLRSDVVVLALLGPLSIFLLNLGGAEDWLLPFNLTNILTILGVAICVRAFCEERISWRVFALAVAGALIASLSSAGGLFAWIAFFPLLPLLGADYRKLLAWIALALGIWIPYNIGVTHPLALIAPLDFLRYILLFLGASVTGQNPSAALFFGVLGVVLLALNLVVFFVLRVDPRRVAAWLALAFYELMLAVAGDLARAKTLGVDEALTPRYAVLQMGWWAALIVLTAVSVQELGRILPARRGDLAPRRVVALVATAALLLTVGGSAVVAGLTGFASARLTYENSGFLQAQQTCVRRFQTAPDSCLALYEPFSPSLVRAESGELRQLHMGIFY